MASPYYQDDWVTIYHGDCRQVLPDITGVVITDPPFNVGYHYAGYDDKLADDDYSTLLTETCRQPSAVIHYPEEIFVVSAAVGIHPTKTAAWVYNANTPRKWRMVAWFGIEPNFQSVRQPYKNLSDRRIERKLDAGSGGAAIYDWWHIEQVKNVSSSKTVHPCQMPIEVMRRVVGVTPGELIIDPFMGSGTTLRAAKDLGRTAVGIELEERYCEIAAARCSQEVLDFGEVA